MALSDYLVTDDLTIILALDAAGLFLLHNLYKPQALVHPILLGRQSDAARVRNPSESAVYRNYGTGMLGRVSTPISSIPAPCELVAVPRASDQRSASPPRPRQTRCRCSSHSLVNQGEPCVHLFARTIVTHSPKQITNPQLRERVANFGAGLATVAGLVPQESNVLLLLNDGIGMLPASSAHTPYRSHVHQSSSSPTWLLHPTQSRRSRYHRCRCFRLSLRRTLRLSSSPRRRSSRIS